MKPLPGALESVAAPAGIKAKTARRNFDIHLLIIAVLVFVTAFVIFATLRYAGDYYLTTIAQRPHHALHQLFKPSGLIGQGLGVVGGLFCLLTLLYPLRKHWRWLENLGTLRMWFQYHVYFGISGPLFATLHTTFKFGGLASICYWSMMVVMASGFIGRFLFALLPRNRRGLALSLQDLDREIQAIQRQLEAAGFRDHQLEAPAKTYARKIQQAQNRQTGWLDIIRLWRARRRFLRAWSRQLQQQKIDPSSSRKILSRLSRKLFLQGSMATLNLTTAAFSHWHTLHLPFTYIMFATLIIHVGLAIFLGYTWIF